MKTTYELLEATFRDMILEYAMRDDEASRRFRKARNKETETVTVKYGGHIRSS